MFTLSGGRISPYYLDLRVIPSFPDAFHTCSELLGKSARSIEGIDKIGGIPTGGLPWASVLAYTLSKPLVYTRKDIKLHGREKTVEGILTPGERVLLIDDVITTGKNILTALQSIRGEGGVVEDALVLLDRQEGGGQHLMRSQKSRPLHRGFSTWTQSRKNSSTNFQARAKKRNSRLQQRIPINRKIQEMETTLSIPRELQVTRSTLENGLKVLIREIPNAPVAGCWTIYRVGSRNEKPGLTGISHWVEHMLFKGGGKLAKGDIGRLVSRVGGEYNGFTSKDFTAYYEILPADHIETGLLIESERMMNAAFDPREVESERSVVVSEREGNENDPEFQATEELFLTAFRYHPYRWSEGGTKPDLQRITRDDLFEHYRRYYAPGNAMLVVAGPFSPKKILPKIEESFAPLSKTENPPEPNIVEPAQAGERRVELRIPSEADYIKVAYHTPGFGNEDVYGLMMLDAVLSGVRLFAFGPGQTSGRSARLYRALVEKKIATQASSEFFPTIDPSVFALDLTVWDGVNIDKAEKLLFDEIERIKRTPPSRHELDRSLAQIRSQYSYTFDGVARQGFVIGIFELVISFETIAKLVDKLSKVTADKISEIARKYLTVENRTVCRTVGTRNSHGH